MGNNHSLLLSSCGLSEFEVPFFSQGVQGALDGGVEGGVVFAEVLEGAERAGELADAAADEGVGDGGLDLGEEDAAGEEFEYGDLVGEGEPLVLHCSAHLPHFLAGEGATVEAVFESVAVAFGSAAGGPQFRDAMGAAKRMTAHGPGLATGILTATVVRRWFVHRASCPSEQQKGSQGPFAWLPAWDSLWGWLDRTNVL